MFFLNEDKIGYEQMMPKNFKKQPAHLQQGLLANTLEKKQWHGKNSPRNSSGFQLHPEKTHWGSEVQAFDNVITNFYFRS